MEHEHFHSKKKRLIMWLLALLLFENEFTHLKENGSDTFEGIFEIKRIDIFEINKKSAV